MSPKRQFKMQLDEDQIERLKAAADRLGRDTAQEVAEEILTIYYPVWLAVAESASRAIDYQTAKILEQRSGSKPKVNGNIELIPDSRIAHLEPEELTDETAKQKPARRKAGKR
jgi:hypothetical protein